MRQVSQKYYLPECFDTQNVDFDFETQSKGVFIPIFPMVYRVKEFPLEELLRRQEKSLA